MSRKQAIVNESSAGAAAARAAKPKTPRVNSAKHSKKSASETGSAEIDVTIVEPVMVVEEVVEPVVVIAAPVDQAPVDNSPQFSASVRQETDARHEIAKIAYGYWEARGCQGGDPLEDWVRAEHEYLRTHAA